jgi:hypothetical protein
MQTEEHTKSRIKENVEETKLKVLRPMSTVKMDPHQNNK